MTLTTTPTVTIGINKHEELYYFEAFFLAIAANMALLMQEYHHIHFLSWGGGGGGRGGGGEGQGTGCLDPPPLPLGFGPTCGLWHKEGVQQEGKREGE